MVDQSQDRGKMEIDLYNYNLNLAIGCQGLQHYKFVKHFHKTYKDWELVKERDILKAAIE